VQQATPQVQMSDLDVLNYALTLEHLTYAYFRDGIGHLRFGADSRGASIDDNLVIVRDQESDHVATLTQEIVKLGGSPVAEATYDFGDAFDDPAKFIETAVALENTSVDAYDGAVQYLTDPDVLAIASSIAAVEARHASYLTLLNGQLPFPAAFETPLAPAAVQGITRPLTAS
jgi:rubrerythrin